MARAMKEKAEGTETYRCDDVTSDTSRSFLHGDDIRKSVYGSFGGGYVG